MAFRLCGWALAFATLSGQLVAATKRLEACEALARVLPDSVVLPNSTLYIESNNYWSNRQKEVHPDCFVTPRTSDEVAKVVKILTGLKSAFSVKSGGHTAFPGGSNVEDGVTIDLVRLDSIVVSPDRKTVAIGPGNRWIDVSDTLSPQGLAVVGGRVADVGVSGLILGGGISYFSGLHGWACDNVKAFEVVLASGKIVTASATTNADLFRALRGGAGSNFGIVTRFDLDAFPQGDIWASTFIYPGALNTTLIPTFADLALNGLPADPAAHTYFVTTYQPAFGGYIVLASFYHATLPSPPESVPAVFQPFTAFPPIFSSTAVTNISAQSMAIDQPYGQRQTWWCTTVFLKAPQTAQLLTDIVPLFQAKADALIAAASASGTTLLPFLVFQPISANIVQAMQKRGGNALGLKPSEGPLVIVQLTASWDDPALDPLVEESFKSLVGQVDALAKTRRLHKGLVYMNYAGRTQDVLKSYGAANYARLKATAKKYDPKGELQKLWKGYFQL